jgi:hypothetical protein
LTWLGPVGAVTELLGAELQFDRVGGGHLCRALDGGEV